MMNPYKVLLKPHITEKCLTYKDKEGTYIFKVDVRATKEDIKRSVETIFKVHVVDVRTVNYRGKPRRRRMFEGLRPRYKKAYVKLMEGEKIPAFEGL